MISTVTRGRPRVPGVKDWNHRINLPPDDSLAFYPFKETTSHLRPEIRWFRSHHPTHPHE